MKRNTRWKPPSWLWLPLFLLFLLASSRATAVAPGVLGSAAPEPIWPTYIQGGLPDPPGPPGIPLHPGWMPQSPTSWRPQVGAVPGWSFAVPPTILPHISHQPSASWTPRPAWQTAPSLTVRGRYPVARYVPSIRPYQPQLGHPRVYAPILGAPSHQRLSLRPGAPR